MKPMRFRQNEVLRYLGVRANAAPDAATLQKVEQAEALVRTQAAPRFVSAVFPLQVEEGVVQIGSMRVQSAQLARYLRGCTETVLFAATLGAGPDRLSVRLAATDVALMAAVQAAGASLLETYCDDCSDEIAARAAARGLYARPRFSPGYGDFALAHQKDFIRLLDCPRRLGLTLTDSCMLAPTKSVTAVIGLTPEPQACRPDKCAACGKTDCAFRRMPG